MGEPLISLMTSLLGDNKAGMKFFNWSLKSFSISENTNSLNVIFTLDTPVTCKFAKLKGKSHNENRQNLPSNFPSKCGFVATFNPGWGMRKHPI